MSAALAKEQPLMTLAIIAVKGKLMNALKVRQPISRVGLMVLSLTLLVFANGRWIIPLATWLAPILLMRFARTQPAGNRRLPQSRRSSLQKS